MRVHELSEARKVGFARNRRVDHPANPGFQVFKHVWVGEGKLGFVPIQDLKKENFVAMKAKLLKTERDIIRGL